MWELDCEEGWVLKNWCFRTVVLERILSIDRPCLDHPDLHPTPPYRPEACILPADGTVGDLIILSLCPLWKLPSIELSNFCSLSRQGTEPAWKWFLLRDLNGVAPFPQHRGLRSIIPGPELCGFSWSLLWLHCLSWLSTQSCSPLRTHVLILSILSFFFFNFKIFNSYMCSQTWTPLPHPSP